MHVRTKSSLLWHIYHIHTYMPGAQKGDDGIVLVKCRPSPPAGTCTTASVVHAGAQRWRGSSMLDKMKWGCSAGSSVRILLYYQLEGVKLWLDALLSFYQFCQNPILSNFFRNCCHSYLFVVGSVYHNQTICDCTIDRSQTQLSVARDLTCLVCSSLPWSMSFWILQK